jgi:hypothetical protein
MQHAVIAIINTAWAPFLPLLKSEWVKFIDRQLSAAVVGPVELWAAGRGKALLCVVRPPSTNPQANDRAG